MAITTRRAGGALAVAVLAALGMLTGCAEPGGTGDAAARPEVSTEAGQLRGVLDPGPGGDVIRYRGVPYAQPPVGDLRWSAPRPVVTEPGVRDAATSGPPCVQNAGQLPQPSLTEDCLYLDITAPAVPRPGRPVVVWVHGGSLETGTGAQYDPRTMALRGDVVVVTVNYRLGAMGFLALPGMDPTAGAQGLADQQQALRFVQRNAAAFGGDPGNVTLFGESGGGVSTCAQLAAPGARGLFQRAIIQSAVGFCGDPIEPGAVGRDVPLSDNVQPRAAVQARSLAAAARLGCADPARALSCLRRLPPERLLAEGQGLNIPAYGGPDAVLPSGPAAAIRDGRAARVPVLQGVNSQEAGYTLAAEALGGRPLPTASEYEALVRKGWGRDADRILAQYPLSAYRSPGDAWVAAHSDGSWTCPSFRLNGALSGRGPTYGYEFADASFTPLPYPPGLTQGSTHGSEIPYLLDIALPPGSPPPPAFTPDQQRLSDEAIRVWTTFARTGDPTTPAYTPADRRVALIGAPGRGPLTAEDRHEAHHCGLWDDISAHH